MSILPTWLTRRDSSNKCCSSSPSCSCPAGKILCRKGKHCTQLRLQQAHYGKHQEILAALIGAVFGCCARLASDAGWWGALLGERNSPKAYDSIRSSTSATRIQENGKAKESKSSMICSPLQPCKATSNRRRCKASGVSLGGLEWKSSLQSRHARFLYSLQECHEWFAAPISAWLAPRAKRLLSQWMLHWWRVSGSAAREPFLCTHPLTPSTNWANHDRYRLRPRTPAQLCWSSSRVQPLQKI